LNVVDRIVPTHHSKRLLVVDGSARFLLSVRGPVLQAAVHAGHEVTACAALDTSMHDVQFENMEDKYQQIGVTFRELHMQRQGMNPLHDLRACVELWIVMRQIQPDVVLSYSVKSSLYGSLAAKLSRVPRIFSAITGLGYLFSPASSMHGFLMKVAQRSLGMALSTNNRVFFQNPDDRDLFLELGLLPDENRAVVVAGSGVDITYFSMVPFPSSSITFLMVARLQYHKGVVEYVQAARVVKRLYPEARFQLLGPFDDHPSAIPRSQVEEWRGEGAVEFLGGTQDVRPFIARCHVFVLPSYREGTSRSMLEAMAMGRPIITTDAPGCREPVRPGHNGFLVPVRNADALASVMLKYLETPELIERMGQYSRQIAEEKYDVNKVAAAMMQIMGL